MTDKKTLLKIVEYCVNKEYYLPWSYYNFLLLFYKYPNKSINEITNIAIDEKYFFNSQSCLNLTVKLTQFGLLKREKRNYKKLNFTL